MLNTKQVSGFALTAVCLAALLLGIVWNLLFAIADLSARRNQTDGTHLAMRLMPANGAFPAQLADQLYASDPAAAKSLLQRAVRLNRYNASSWIQLGLLSEAGNEIPQAEEALLQAASVDSTFLPSWSLANFYFRQRTPTASGTGRGEPPRWPRTMQHPYSVWLGFSVQTRKRSKTSCK